ncbi:MAG: proton-conducting transporter membrane subunit [Isosphaeraceae bacterium]
MLQFPWLETAIGLSAAGSLAVGLVRNPVRAARLGMAITGVVFACTFLAWLGFHLGVPVEGGLAARWPGPSVFGLDDLSAPLVPAVALLHFLTSIATAKTRMRYFAASWSLASETIRLAMFSCTASWLLVFLLVLCTLPPYFELVNRGRPTRVYALHMGLFAALLLVGWSAVSLGGGRGWLSALGAVPLLLAILIRCGTVPAHCWVADWFEHASFGNGLLFVAPLAGVYAAVRLVLPIAPGWALHGIGLASLATTVYAAGMAIIQREARRFFAYLFLSSASLVLVGIELVTEISLTGSLCLWFSAILSLGGFGLTLRAIESRFGRLSLDEYHGLYDHTPALAVGFLLTGLASVGFPGTLGFISTELLVDGAVEYNLSIGILVIAAAALNSIAIVRAYLRLFTGKRHASTISLKIGLRERVAVLTLAALMLGGGLYPQPGVSTRLKAAEALLAERARRTGALPPQWPPEGRDERP